MACFHPIEAYQPAGVGDARYGQPRRLRFSFPADYDRARYNVVKVPCGKCVGCRMDYSRQWANRCLLEMQYHEHSWFLTLTYDDIHLPKTYTADPDTGEAISPVATLSPRDFTLFVKRLRKNTGQKLRIFGCGEYGSDTLRPHYHIIVFGLSLASVEPYKRSELGDMYYTSPVLDACWTASDGSSKGFIVASSANWQTCAYVARYVLKKQTGKSAKLDYEKLGIEPPFLRMSRRPGIGAQWFEDHPEYDLLDTINISTPDGGRQMPVPKYYRDKLKELYPVTSDWLSMERVFAAENRDKIVAKLLTNLSQNDILSNKERAALKKAKLLRRDL